MEMKPFHIRAHVIAVTKTQCLKLYMLEKKSRSEEVTCVFTINDNVGK
jgi:hypothetical protein